MLEEEKNAKNQSFAKEGLMLVNFLLVDQFCFSPHFYLQVSVLVCHWFTQKK